MASRSYRFFNGRIPVLSHNPSNPSEKDNPLFAQKLKIRPFQKRPDFFILLD
jgi:hypothetical protein